MVTTKYWCRYHGRTENTNMNDACRTNEEISAEHRKPSKSDPPSLGARIKMLLGFGVKP
jgi:hypothetical protein